MWVLPFHNSGARVLSVTKDQRELRGPLSKLYMWVLPFRDCGARVLSVTKDQREIHGPLSELYMWVLTFRNKCTSSIFVVPFPVAKVQALSVSFSLWEQGLFEIRFGFCENGSEILYCAMTEWDAVMKTWDQFIWLVWEGRIGTSFCKDILSIAFQRSGEENFYFTVFLRYISICTRETNRILVVCVCKIPLIKTWGFLMFWLYGELSFVMLWLVNRIVECSHQKQLLVQKTVKANHLLAVFLLALAVRTIAYRGDMFFFLSGMMKCFQRL